MQSFEQVAAIVQAFAVAVAAELEGVGNGIVVDVPAVVEAESVEDVGVAVLVDWKMVGFVAVAYSCDEYKDLEAEAVPCVDDARHHTAQQLAFDGRPGCTEWKSWESKDSC